jgi:hypothetical protein
MNSNPMIQAISLSVPSSHSYDAMADLMNDVLNVSLE